MNLLPLQQCDDVAQAGGKAVNLGVLLRAGFPVPGGFAVTTAAYRAAREAGGIADELAAEIRAAYAAMGGGTVAVRSSATAEDMAGASMAGQYETCLNIVGEEAVLSAIQRCWQSLDTPRTRAYLAEQGIDISRVAMAVVVQKQVQADIAGVLFTANPRTGSRQEMLAEACWGLGEALVSGRVQPDVLRIDRATGNVLEQRIADKRVMIAPGNGHELSPVPDTLRHVACMPPHLALRLWEVGLKSAQQFGGEQDLEWAIEAGQLYLLQSRPITTLAEADAANALIAAEKSSLQADIAAGRGPWVRHNLGETLPLPTPLSWSVMQQFMTGDGGFGQMYRLAGFDPSPAVRTDGFLRLIAGRIYMDASRAAGMFFDRFPFRYDLESLRTNPDAAQAPPTIPAGSLRDRFRAGRRIAAIQRSLAQQANDLDHRLRHDIFPAFAEYVRQEKSHALSSLPRSGLADLWRRRRRKVLDDFAPLSLLPSLVEGMVLGDLRQVLAEQVWDEDADELSRFLSSSPVPNMTLLADAALFEVAQGKLPAEDWLAKYGHRAAGEFDLATPRWREQPDALRAAAARLAGGQSPMALHEHHAQKVRQRAAELRATMTQSAGDDFAHRLDRVWRYIVFREDGKYYLMLGYDLLRDVAIEAGQRLGIGDGVFFLTESELLAALQSPAETSAELPAKIAQRKLEHRAQARLSLPHMVNDAALPTLGQPAKLEAGTAHEAFAVSAGQASGPARVVLSPTEAGDLGRGYVLVCASTDPNWTPLFVNAAALVLECGGTLSHGAVVAREMGLPAVVLPDATRLFTDGQMIAVDGDHGAVSALGGTGKYSYPCPEDAENHRQAYLPVPPAVTRVCNPSEPCDEQETLKNQLDYEAPQHGLKTRVTETPSEPADVRIPPSLVPPPAGPKDRRAARWRNWGLAIWGVYLLLVFLLPQDWLYAASLRGLDQLFWWLVPLVGKPWTVAIVAAGVAVLTMLLQRRLVDNHRLLEAKRRAQVLTKQAEALPADSPRRAAIARLTAPIQVRVLAAAMVPLAVGLGPMVMTFMWMPARMDPASWSPPAGSTVFAVATVDRMAGGSAIQLETPADLIVQESKSATVEDTSAATAALRELLKAWENSPGDRSPEMAETIADLERSKATKEELRRAIEAGVSPRAITWTVTTPAHQPHGGRWPITLRTDTPARTLHLVVGDQYPPEDVLELESDDPGRAGMRLVFPHGKPQAFWVPLSSVEWNWVRTKGWNNWDAGWLGVYLLAYLPAMLIAKRALRVA